jgi:hypothetical protein
VHDDVGPFAVQLGMKTSSTGRGNGGGNAGAAQQQDGAVVAQMLDAQERAALCAASAMATASGIEDAGADHSLRAEQPLLLGASQASWASWPSFSSAAGGSVELPVTADTAQLQPEQQRQHPQQQGAL